MDPGRIADLLRFTDALGDATVSKITIENVIAN